MFDLNFSDDLSKLNFIGVVSLFGGDIALSALRYTSLVPGMYLSLYLTMVLSPGLQAVAVKMFRQMDDMVSRAIGGNAEDNKDILALHSRGKYRYMGMHSGTNMVIGNILGEVLLKTAKPMETIHVACSRKRKPNINRTLKVIELHDLSESDRGNLAGSSFCLANKPSGYRSILLYTIPILTFAGTIVTVLGKDYGVFSLILMNIICNVLMIFTIRSNGFRYPIGTSNMCSPKGDIFVGSSDGTDSFLVIGDERVIQYIFQKPLAPPPELMTWKRTRLLVTYLSYFVSIVNIIWLPFCTIGGQIIFGGLTFLAIVQNITLATFDGDEELLASTIDRLNLVKHCKKYVFQTRPTMIAFCMLRAESNSPKPLRHLLPDTKTFDAWFDEVANTLGGKLHEDSVVDDLLDVLVTDLRDAVNECRKHEL